MSKRYTERVSVPLEPEMLDWLKEKVRKGEAASLAHAIRRCIQQVEDREENEKDDE